MLLHTLDLLLLVALQYCLVFV